MRNITILLLLLPFTYLQANEQKALQKRLNEPLTDELMREVTLPILPTWIAQSSALMARVTSTESLMGLVDLVYTLKETAATGVPEELSYAINLQDFLDDLTDPDQDLDYLGQILKEIFERAGVKFDLKFENVQTRGHYKMIYIDNQGNELFSHDRADFIGRLSITNIRFGDTETSIGNIYISNWDWAPGNVMRIQVRE